MLCLRLNNRNGPVLLDQQGNDQLRKMTIDRAVVSAGRLHLTISDIEIDREAAAMLAPGKTRKGE